ncbi:translocation protein SEC62-like isoform X2 [Ruditapes philippinarum]|uniref:translocation protein SEC62-like isoform X2 n=1 Tax=Ruditapes philippinarum TaxID=129788 RepID=UPI00295A6224|nr:translocation protein SEC62-like isoform X2 [Ruditapes philippinarum]
METDEEGSDWGEYPEHREEQACTKEEYAVAKHLRFNTPAHTGRLAGMTVKCFIASDAVNCLLDSKWSKGKANPDSEITFTDRKSCVQFLNRFIQKGLFHRADKVESKRDKDKKKKKKDVEEKEKEKEKESDSKKSKKSKKVTEKETKEEEKKEEKKKTDKKEVKLKKFKLNMSDDQRFVDGNSIYVWIYDPIHPKTFFMGFLMLLGAIALCLFPLWPDWMRVGVYYASLLGASFVGFMLFLIVLRVIIFSLVWMVTLGKHHLWIFPNLTEDVGVIESFKPLYKHDIYPPPEIEKEMEKEKKEQEEEGDSENEENKDNDYDMVESKEDTNEEERTGEESEETEQQ